MKRNILYIALFAMAILGLTTACGSDDDGDEVKTPTEKQNQFADDALGLTFDKDANTKINVNGAQLYKVEFTESGNCILSLKESSADVKTRDAVSDILTYMHGTYTVNGSTYTIYINGTKLCDITVQTKSGASTSVTVAFPDAEAVTTAASIAAKLTDSKTKEIVGTWSVVKTRLRHTGDVKAVKEFTGCNLHEILEYAKTKATIKEDFDVNKVVTGITFTSWRTFEINYKDGKPDKGVWNWKNREGGTITYTWDNLDMGNKFENGEATFDVRNGYYCLTLGATIKDDASKNYDISITFYLN